MNRSVGWIVFNKKSDSVPRTGGWHFETRKLYVSEKIARSAMKKSFGSFYKEEDFEYHEVFISTS